jgi:hypothetical protein
MMNNISEGRSRSNIFGAKEMDSDESPLSAADGYLYGD